MECRDMERANRYCNSDSGTFLILGGEYVTTYLDEKFLHTFLKSLN